MNNNIPKWNRLAVCVLGVPDHVGLTTDDATDILVLQLDTSSTFYV